MKNKTKNKQMATGLKDKSKINMKGQLAEANLNTMNIEKDNNTTGTDSSNAGKSNHILQRFIKGG